MIKESHSSFAYKAPYCTLNKYTEKTKRIWLAFHGYGQLSRYFIKKFEGLNADENFIIAPQGTSKFYLEGFYGRVGATWMTKEDRLTDIYNQKAYLDSVLKSEGIGLDITTFHLFGFSQGVSTLLRYMATSKIQTKHLTIWAGSLPPELNRSDFEYLHNDVEITYYTGNEDPFYQPELEQKLKSRIIELFEKEPNVVRFEGKHEVKKELIDRLQ